MLIDFKKEYENLVKYKYKGKELEKHYIIPVYLGGKEDKDNVVYLSKEAHLIAHIFLFYLYPENEDVKNDLKCRIPITDEKILENIYTQYLTDSNVPRVFEKLLESEHQVIISYKEDKIHRIFGSIEEANEVGFKVTRKNLETDGYFWKSYNDFLEDSPNILQSFLKTYKIQPNLIAYNGFLDSEVDFKVNWNKIICQDENNKIIRVYDSIIDAEKDGFSTIQIYKAIGNNEFYKGYHWSYYKKELERKVNLYFTQPKPELKEELSNEKIEILKCDEKNEVVEVFPSLLSIQGINFKSLSKVINSPVDSRLYKGFYWYRTSEYIELFPDKYKNPVDKPKELRILLTISSKLISVNELYKAKVSYTSSGRAYPVLYKNPKAQKVSDEVRNQLLYLDLSSYIPWLEKTKKYSISINFILKTGITRRDCANFEKIMCDDLTRFIKNDLGVEHFDDSEFYECNLVKSICPDAKNEYAYIILKESYYEDRIDIVDKPTRIYLSGPEIPHINWRAKLYEKLKNDQNPNSRLSFYNPLDNIWDEEIKNIERYQRCNTELFVITPNDLTKDSYLEEIIDRVDNNVMTGENRFIYIGVLGDLEFYSPIELGRIELIEKFAKNKTRINFKYLYNISELYNWIKNE